MAMNAITEQGGILCIDKPQGFTSFDVVARLRGIAKTRRIGHAGTLDPMATGVLPLFLGRATKACDLLPDQEKRYRATFLLGVETDTLDITGTVLRRREVNVTRARLETALDAFRGEIEQLPPMYSAVSVGGKRLYELARAGKEVERPVRHVRIHELILCDADEAAGSYTIDVRCSKGTYIRTLAADIGETLGCGATLTALRRTMAAGFLESDCVTIAQAEELAAQGLLGDRLLPIGQAFARLPRVTLTEKQAYLFQNGVRMSLDQLALAPFEGRCGVWRLDGGFLGLGEQREETLAQRALFALPEQTQK